MNKPIEDQTLVERLRIRASIRRNNTERKSVQVGSNGVDASQEGKPDRIADLLEEAADEIESYSQFAWATFDGEGGYYLRLYDMNEDYKDNYIERNGEKYKDWVVPLYIKEPE